MMAKFELVIAWLFIFLSKHCCSCEKNTIAIAMSQVIENHFVKNKMRFNFIVDKTSSKIVNIFESVIKLSSLSYNYKVIGFKENESKGLENRTKRQVNEDYFIDTKSDSGERLAERDSFESIKLEIIESKVFLFNSFSDYWINDTNHDMYKINYESVGHIKLNELIFCKNTSKQEIETKFRESYGRFLQIPQIDEIAPPASWFEQFHLRSYLIEENGEIVMAAISMFTAQQCDVLQVVETNRFSKESLKWQTNKFFTPEINNFHGCEQTFFHFPEILSPLVELIVDAAEVSLNVTFKSGIETNLTFGLGTYHNSYKSKFMTAPIFNGFYCLLIPPGEPYSPFEKLFLPFDFHVWIWFLIVFTVAYIVVFILTFASDAEVKKFIVGEKVKASSVNIFMIFMGGGLTTLPKKNFPRFLLMSFLLYCLIMR